MKANKKGFYERYKYEQKAKEKEQKIKEKYNISDEKTIVIEQKTKIDKALSNLFKFIMIILKIMIYIGIFILSSIGATILMNEALRTTFFELLNIIM